MDLKFTNFATSTVANAGGIGAGDLSVDVGAGEGALFPTIGAGEYFYVVGVTAAGLREIMKVTARATDTLTIVRAQEGTTARAFALGDKLELRLTAASLQVLSDALFEEATNIASFKQNAAPTGWTRDGTMQDNAMLCYAAAGNPGSGGGVNPQTAHTHTGPSHTHTGPSHTHTGPSHTHTGPSHTHTGPSHGHALAVTGSVGSRAAQLFIGQVGGELVSLAAGGSTFNKYGVDTTAAGTGATGADGTGATGADGTGATGADGTGASGANTAPYYQEVIACIKDAY